MNGQTVAAPLRTDFTDQVWAAVPRDLEERFRPTVERIAEEAAARDRGRDLPFDAVRELRDLGIGRARVAVEEGGLGADWASLTPLLIAIAAADANVPQIFRGHFALVEQALTTSDRGFGDRWIRRVVDGQLTGNAWSEASGSTTSRAGTELRADVGGTLRVSGRKFYTTGSIFAEWTDAVAHRVADGVDVAVLVRLDQPGVTVSDDWDGFGQRGTGTGTIVFDDAVVDAADVLPVAERFGYQTALYQLVLLSVLAGIAHRAVSDAADAVRSRARVYSHGTADRAQDDVQIQALIGELAASAYAVESTVHAVAGAVDDAVAAARAVRDDPGDEALRERARAADAIAEIRAAQAQSFATGAVQTIASRLFDALGASSTARGASLDRHWRTARTVSSHNPVLYKNRWVGAWVLTGDLPQPLWAVGSPSVTARG